MGDLQLARITELFGPGVGGALAVVGATIVVWLFVEIMYRVVGRRLTDWLPGDADDQALERVHRAVRTSVGLGGILVLITLFRELDPIAPTLKRAVSTAFLAVWWLALMGAASALIRGAASQRDTPLIQPKTVPLFDTLQKILLTAFVIYSMFLVWNIDVTAWLASAGIVGIAVGFAARDTLANLFAGLFILVDAPYKIGDMIVFETGERGVVKDVGVRSTRILTRDDVEIIIPNAQIGASRIVNQSGGPNPKMRLELRVGVAYDSDPDEVEAALMHVASQQKLACDTPTPRVRLRSMDDSALTFALLMWVRDPNDRGLATHEAYVAILREFRTRGIEIPFPQRVVHWRPGDADDAPESAA